MEHVEIACTLQASELAEARQRYVDAASGYAATARIVDGRASVTLTGEPDALRALLADMIERESHCCAFLDFEAEDSADRCVVHLTAQVPASQSTPLLESMVSTLFPGAIIAGLGEGPGFDANGNHSTGIKRHSGADGDNADSHRNTVPNRDVHQRISA